MVEPPKRWAGYFEPFDHVPEALSYVTSMTGGTDPLIQIVAGRVLLRARWSGGAAGKAAEILNELRQWRTEIERENFLPPPELRGRLMALLTSAGKSSREQTEYIVARTIETLENAVQNPALTPEKMGAIGSALKVLKAQPDYAADLIVPPNLHLLPTTYLCDVVAALFARLNDETVDDPTGNLDFENLLEPLNELRGRFVPKIDALFTVYLAFSGLVLPQWLDWLTEYGEKDPGWVPYTHLMISWQLASVASWVEAPELLTFLNRELQEKDARRNFVALSFVELVIRIRERVGGRLLKYGGGSIAPDVIVPWPSADLALKSAQRHLPAGVEYVVWYATNRQPVDQSDHSKGYSSWRSTDVSYGKCVVRIPELRTFGSLGSPAWKRWFKGYDDRITLGDINTLPNTIFWSDLRIALKTVRYEIGESDILVYLHGFRTSFADAAIRAAQLGADLNVPGLTAFYSWPSKTSPLGYLADAASIEASESYIEEFLVCLARDSGADRVHIIAHSMGNRGLLRALQGIMARAESKGGIKFGQVFLAAPDIDVETFRRFAAVYPRVSERTTLYVSARDRAVWLSFFLHRFPRVGYAPPITVLDGIDTVEVTAIDFSLIGHSAYAEATPLLYDMGALIRENLPPGKRQRIRRSRTSQGLEYWSLQR
jgi:esterase/lipase superfamily enzyme